MSKEEVQKPNRHDEYKNSPFYNPNTGKNVVEEGERIQDEMSDEEAPYIR